MSDEGIAADEIDGRFVPRCRTDVSCVELDGELVVTVLGEDDRPVNFDVHWLDRRATIVWNCLDGETSVDELVEDLSAVFSAPHDVVFDDVLEMTRTLGRRGLLEGVARERLPELVPRQLTSVPVGTELPPFRLLDLAGRERTSEEMGGRRLLLLNWDAACGFCVRITDDLVALLPELQSQSVEVILMTRGSLDDNRRLQDRWGVECTVLLQDDYPLFRGMGTPAAYLSDAAGRVESELALGAPDVVALARRAAGHDQD